LFQAKYRQQYKDKSQFRYIQVQVWGTRGREPSPTSPTPFAATEKQHILKISWRLESMWMKFVLTYPSLTCIMWIMFIVTHSSLTCTWITVILIQSWLTYA
jgi:hypothetical protein